MEMPESPPLAFEFLPESPPPTSSPPVESSPPPEVSPPSPVIESPPPPSASPPPASSPPPSPPQPSLAPPTPESQASPPPVTRGNPTPSTPLPPSNAGHNVPPPATLLSPPTPASQTSPATPVPVVIPVPHSSNPGSPSPDARVIPAPHVASSPPPTTQGSDGSQVAVLVGLTLGIGVLLLLSLLILYTCTKKKKRKIPNYGNPPNGYNGNTPSPGVGHMIQIPPPPGIFNNQGGFGSNTWAAPPPGIISSSGENISAAFSSPRDQNLHSPQSPYNIGFNKSTFTFEELSLATGGFSEANLLGQGGFGYVHKGLLPNGKEVAVKALNPGSGQGEREFQAEVEIISRVHHRYLVTLVGYCIAGDQRLLVYEFIPNNTLEFHLHGEGRPPIDWKSRVKIAHDSAKGLAYLHEDCHPRIIHRDIKSANILLDYSFEAKVADFGLAKLSSDTSTHVSTRVMGTFGYLSPEYASTGKLTDKSDVFSFGVVMLELITGRRPVDLTNKHNMDDSLVDWARPLLARAMEDGDFAELVDPRLEMNFDHQEMMRMAASAAACIRHSARRRPKMSQIVRVLEGDVSLSDLNEMKNEKQNSLLSSSSPSSASDNLYDTAHYNADMEKFRKLALQSGTYASSEFGNTSEYGLNASSTSSSSSSHEEVAKRNQSSKPRHVSFINV